MERELKTREMRSLFAAIASIKTEEECQRFFRDLCTFGELESMAERWNVAQQINKKVPYRLISEKTGSSTATITRVAQWLHHGMGGYTLMLKRMR